MNSKQLNLLIGLVIVVGGLGLILYNKQASSWQATDNVAGGKLLPDLPINDITQITITQGATNLNLVKKDDLWRVQERWDYPANFTDIGKLIRDLWEIETVQSVTVGSSQLGRLELLAPDKGKNSGTRIDFKGKEDKSVSTLLLGKKYVRESDTPSPMGGGGSYPVGRYVMVEDAGNTEQPKVWIISDALTQVEPKADSWLNKDFFKVEKLRSASVTSTNATNSWRIYRETESGDLNLADLAEGEEFDKSKASSVGYLLSSPSFNDVVSPDKDSTETGMDAAHIAKIETFDNFVYTLKIGNSTADDNYHLTVSVEANITKERTPGEDEKPEDKERLDTEFNENVEKLEEKLKMEQAAQNWTYLVSKWTIDTLLKERAEFMADEAAETDAENTPTSAFPSFPTPDVAIPPPLPTLIPPTP